MRTIGISLALPLFVGGMMLAAFGSLTKTAEAADEVEKAVEMEEAAQTEVRAVAQTGDEDEAGYGYVFSLPDDGDPIDAAEKAAQMERAAVLARLGAGWERGEILAEDLQILVASARSQIEVYNEELQRLQRTAEGEVDLEALRRSLAQAREHVAEFERVGVQLRQTMVGLQSEFEAASLETEPRAVRPTP